MHDMHEYNAMPEIHPVLDATDVQRMTQTAAAIFASPLLKQYVIDLVTATRNHPELRLGASPRAAIQLLQMSRVKAAMAGRKHVLPEYVQTHIIQVLSLRILTRAATSAQ